MVVTKELESRLQEQMGSWYNTLLPWIQSEDADKVFSTLKQLKSQGKKLAPDSKDLWNAFKECPRDKFRVLLLGLCPYHTFRGSIPDADGIMFSNSNKKNHEQPNPSLATFYEGMEEDLYSTLTPLMPKWNDLRYLSNQGILMLNCQLTVTEGMAGSHTFWDNWCKWFIEEELNKNHRGIICVFMGAVASKYEKLVNPMQHYTKCIEHPAASSYRKGTQSWKHDKMFSYINTILKQNNGDEINWPDLLPF